MFTPQNLVIAAAGNVEHEHLLDLVSSALSTAFSRQPPQESRLKAGLIARPETSSPIVIKQRPDLEQAHLVLATPFPDARDSRRYAADLTASIIGGGTASRLWQKVREERGLAYNVGASTTMYDNVGVFSVFAATSPEQVRDVVGISVDEMRNVVRDGVTAEELDLAKAQARTSVLLSLEDSASRAAALAQSEMVHGRQISVEETLAGIEAVTVEDCQTLADEFFRPEGVMFAAMGDLADLSIDRGDLAVS
jgi:predicted Zn-dependent peptidase